MLSAWARAGVNRAQARSFNRTYTLFAPVPEAGIYGNIDQVAGGGIAVRGRTGQLGPATAGGTGGDRAEATTTIGLPAGTSVAAGHVIVEAEAPFRRFRIVGVSGWSALMIVVEAELI